MLETHDRIDWTKLEGAYGPAGDVPKILQAVASAKGAFDSISDPEEAPVATAALKIHPSGASGSKW